MVATAKFVNTIIVGGGHAGVNLACMLELNNNNNNKQPADYYLVLERSSSLLSKWRDCRWEGFQLNTPVKMALLHGQEDDRDEWLLDRPLAQDLERWDAHMDKIGIQSELNTNVVQVIKEQETDEFLVTVEKKTEDGSCETCVYKSKNLVACNGCFDAPKIPTAMADKFPPSIKQHSVSGFKFDDLAPGNILVVGSGQSGCQLCDLLLNRVPKIYLCTSATPGVFRSLEGKDLFAILEEMNYLTFPRAVLDGLPQEKKEAMKYAKNPVTRPCRELSPFSLQREGVTLLGGLKDIDVAGDGKVAVSLRDNLSENLQVAMGGFERVLESVTEHFKKENPDFSPTLPPEWSDVPKELFEQNGDLSLDLEECNITNVLWCTGWSHNLSWLDGVPESLLDRDEKTNYPDVIQSKNVPGLFYCGFPWIGTLQSLNLVNFDPDAKVVMENLRPS